MAICETHDIEHDDIERCPECCAAVAMAVIVGPPKADTSRLRVVAARYRLNELSCWSNLKANKDDGHVAVKWSAESGKWATRADELEAKIIEIEHDQWLVDQKRSLGN